MPILLAQLGGQAGAGNLSAEVVSQVSENSSALIWGLGLALGLSLAGLVVRLVMQRLSEVKASLGMVVLRVLVPRDTGVPTDKPQAPPTPQQIQEQIGVAEVLWSTIGARHAQRGVASWFTGRSDHLALELVAHEGSVSFYLAVPRQLSAFVEQQVQAHYPHAVLEEVADYNIFAARGASAGVYLKLARGSVFPIKTYKTLDTDPLNAITNALAKVPVGSGAAVQLVVRPARHHWRREAVRIASAMQQGKPLKEVTGQGVIWRTLRGLGGFLPSRSGSQHKEKNKPPEPYRLSPLEEEMVKGLEQKASKAGLDVTVRLVTSAPTAEAAFHTLENLSDAFGAYSIFQYGNRFTYAKAGNTSRFMYAFIHRTFAQRHRFVLNVEELASVYHFPLPSTETPNIAWLAARKAPPPQNISAEGVVLGVNEYRGVRTMVRLARADRARHLYVVGKSGTGKSVLLENLAVQDIAAGEGVCVIDPHGDLIDAILARVPVARADDVILFEPSDVDRPQGLNLLEYDPRYPEQKTFVINEMIKILDKLYDLRQTGGPMFEQYMRNAMLLIMDDPESGATLMEISKVLADPDYRRYKLSKVVNPVVHDFWTKEAQKAGGEASLANMVPYITSKLNQFVANDIMRPIIGQQQSAFNLRDIMDQRRILLVKLSKGKLGDLNAYLLGLVMVGKVLMAALSRTDVPEAERKDFYLYIDEFQNFITDSINVILSEARKYHLNLTIAHQYLGQLVQGNDSKTRDAVFGNVGTLASFRVGVEDAEFLAKEFAPVFSAYDVINLGLYTCYLKLLIGNLPARPCNITTLPPDPGDPGIGAKLKELSRLRYGRSRPEVEAEILERAKRAAPPPPAAAPSAPAAQPKTAV